MVDRSSIINGIVERVGIIIKSVGIIIKGIVVIERVAIFPETRLRHFPFFLLLFRKLWSRCRGFRGFRGFGGWALEYGGLIEFSRLKKEGSPLFSSFVGERLVQSARPESLICRAGFCDTGRLILRLKMPLSQHYNTGTSCSTRSIFWGIKASTIAINTSRLKYDSTLVACVNF